MCEIPNPKPDIGSRSIPPFEIGVLDLAARRCVATHRRKRARRIRSRRNGESADLRLEKVPGGFLMKAHSISTICWISTVVTLGLAGCGGGGGGGGQATVLMEMEGNNTSVTANALTVGASATGSLDAVGDIDYWSVPLVAGQNISIELLATRFDQGHWDDNVGKNLPRLTVWDVDGTTKLLEHDYSGNTSAGWGWGRHDLDIPLYRVATTGTHFVSIRQDNPAADGGDYVVTVRTQTLAGYQAELEPSGVSGLNDTTGTAESIVPGNVHGNHVDNETDAFSFQVTGPSIVHFELTSYRNGVFHGDDAYFDPRLRLIDSNGATQLASNNDAFFSDPAIQYRIDTPGTYFVLVDEQTGTGDADYFLNYSTSDAANPTLEIESNDTTGTAQALSYATTIDANATTVDDDFFSFTGSAGDVVRVQCFHSDNWREATDTVSVQALDSDGATPLLTDPEGSFHTQAVLLQHSGTFYLRVPAAASASAYSIHLARVMSSAWEVEDNGAIARANPLDVNGRGSGVVIDANDRDFFSFPAAAGVPVTVQIYAAKSVHSDGFFEYSGLGSALPSRVRLFNAAGNQLSESHYGKVVGTEGVITGLPTGAASFIPQATGTYYARVEAVNNAGQADYHYVIEKR
jgi:hypothetical protein